MKTYPSDTLEATLRNVFDFDVYKPETIEKLAEILDHHGLVSQRDYCDFADSLIYRLAVKHLGLVAAREASRKKVLDIKFSPKETTLSQPKYGKVDPNNQPHTGGNTWAGGVRLSIAHRLINVSSLLLFGQTGGRDTAGLGGRGGYMRLFAGHDIHQARIPHAHIDNGGLTSKLGVG